MRYVVAAALPWTGAPTMGGLAFVPAAIAGILASTQWSASSPSLALGVYAVLGFGAIGLVDDILKVALGRPLGLRGRVKLFAQVALGLLVGSAILRAGVQPYVHVPVLGRLDLGPAYAAFVALMLVSAANAVNLTDGLDGLAAGSCAISFGIYGVMSAAAGCADMIVFCLGMMGSLVGFLPYNLHPARVFMGDTGSMALGAGLAVAAALTKTELLLIVIGGLYVLESVSVMLQVVSFKTTGRRLFRMSPIHHHFELGGWPEEAVVSGMWVFSLVCGLVGLAWFMRMRA
ncbi:MAG: phospho-N-acetylmuramoyl-pentapeptide-transferase [Firmicutes bacterium]|nr:phospho-N-acetylmuramoyl-pentapeptide-transferase [Bacillota bacterium]